MRRWILSMLMYVILGALVTVGIAWGVAYWGERPGTPLGSGSVANLFVSRSQVEWGWNFWVEGGPWQWNRIFGPFTRDDAPYDLKYPDPIHARPEWSRFDIVTRDLMMKEKSDGIRGDDLPVYVICEDLIGWPVPCMWRAMCLQEQVFSDWQPPQAAWWVGALRGSEADILNEGESLLNSPVLPLWPRFGLNVLLLGCLFAGIHVSLIGLRRGWIHWWRIRRGFCRTCGYNLAGNTSGKCPECGAKTTSAVA